MANRTASQLGVVLEEKMNGLWGSLRQYAFGKTVARLLRHYEITEMELNPIFTMMLFPRGGGRNELELRTHYYAHDIHNPAVIRGVMRDAFAYVSEYHGVQTKFSCPEIHVDPNLQMLITGKRKKKKGGDDDLHWSWDTFKRLLSNTGDRRALAAAPTSTKRLLKAI